MTRKIKNEYRVVGVIQARIGSTRLPRKVLKKIDGKTMIEIISERLSACRELDGIVLSVPDNHANDVLVDHGKWLGLSVVSAPENDIIRRMLEAAKVSQASAVVRITADCPLVDPTLVDKVVRVYKNNPSRYDYLGNILVHTFPVGLGFEIFTTALLKKLDKKLKTSKERELVSTYVKTKWPLPRMYNLEYKINTSHIRLTVDYPEDLRLIRALYSALAKQNKLFILSDILKYLDIHPALIEMNKKRVDNEQLINPRYETKNPKSVAFRRKNIFKAAR